MHSRTATSFRIEKRIHALALEPHPERGYFRETYRAREDIVSNALPGRDKGFRPFATHIY